MVVLCHIQEDIFLYMNAAEGSRSNIPSKAWMHEREYIYVQKVSEGKTCIFPPVPHVHIYI